MTTGQPFPARLRALRQVRRIGIVGAILCVMAFGGAHLAFAEQPTLTAPNDEGPLRDTGLEAARRASLGGRHARAVKGFERRMVSIQRQVRRGVAATDVGPARGPGPLGEVLGHYLRGPDPVLIEADDRFYFIAAVYRHLAWSQYHLGDKKGAARTYALLLASTQGSKADIANAVLLLEALGDEPSPLRRYVERSRR